jgi:predicted NBD/HSP70 family sugar kinase
MYVSGVGVLAGVCEYRTAYPDSPLTALDVVTTADVLDTARAGDGLANRVLSEAEDVLALLASICVGLLNPALFVIGGGLGLALSERWIAALERDLPKRTLEIANRGVRVARAQVESSAVGAAALVWEATGG